MFMQFPPSIQSHSYSSLSGIHAVQSSPTVIYNPPISIASEQYPAQYVTQLEPTQVTSTVMESQQVTETIMVPKQITKTILVPKQVTSTVNYGAQEAGSIQGPTLAWLLREEEISCIFEEMDKQVQVMPLICSRMIA